jgi:hypothetical protein
MSMFIGGGPGSYPTLFAVPTRDRTEDFARRFGLSRVRKRNKNLIKTLLQPEQALTDVDNGLGEIAKRNADKFQDYLGEMRNLGFGEEEAQARADAMIGRDIATDLGLLQLKFPYAVGGAEAGGWDPVSAVLNKNASFRQLPNTFKAVNQGHMGIGDVKGIRKKKMKKRFKKKFARKFGKRR